MIGQTLKHYRIDSKLGEGGMGVVYKALDMRLDRFVALKVLPSEKVANLERKRRFVQEAKAASALSHPNIVHIYEIDQANCVDFIAMEYVEGRTLVELIGRKGLKLGEVLRYAVQIADGLAAAHATGIVHRDVKPGNIIVSEKGLVKILDFGLAKLSEPEEADAFGSTQTVRPLTEEGAIVGTVAYMSPEQAEGKKVDSRSDIFSFGSVLYEMITGRRAFQGDTKISTLSAILHQEPKPLRESLGSAPREMERVIALCLRKDRGRRFQHMDDVKTLLENMREESDSGWLASGVPTNAVPRRWPYAMALATGIILVATLSGMAWWLTRPRPPFRGPILTRLTSDSGLTTDPALSPDGKWLAYASDRSGEENLDIWVRQVAGGEALRLTSDVADDHEPAFSPDGSKIAFRSERQQGAGIYVVPTLGGEARLIAGEGRRPKFSPDGTQIAYWVGVTATGTNNVYVVPSAGGSPRRIQPEFGGASHPTWSPDGKSLLFLGNPNLNRWDSSSIDWYAAPINGGTAIKTGVYAELRRDGLVASPVGSPIIPDLCSTERSSCLFSTTLAGSTNLWEIPFLSNWKVAGPPRRLTFGTTLEVQPSVPLLGAGDQAKTEGAMLVAFASLNENIDIWGLPLDANRGTPAGEPQRLTTDAGEDVYVDMSPEGKKLVFVSARSGNPEVWMKDLGTGKETPMTVTGPRKYYPALSPSNLKLAYSVYENRQPAIYVLSLRPSTHPSLAERVCTQCGGNARWSPDEKTILSLDPYGSVCLVEVASGQRTTVIERQESYSFVEPILSPDGEWLSFIAQHTTARSRVYVVPFRAGQQHAANQWIAVTDGASWDDTPRWSPDGSAVYFISERDGFRCIWIQPLDPATKRPVGSPAGVYHSHSARRSLLNVRLAALSIAVARDKVVFNMGERTGNIWMANLEVQK